MLEASPDGRLRLTQEAFEALSRDPFDASRHARFHALCRTVYRPRMATPGRQAEALRENGFAPLPAVLSGPECDALSAKISDRLAEPDADRALIDAFARANLPRNPAVRIAVLEEAGLKGLRRWIARALRTEVMHSLEGALGSHLRIDHLELIRTTPMGATDGSYRWHVDRAPEGEVHIIVYLTDPRPDGSGGVTEFVPRRHVEALGAAGYFTRPLADRLETFDEMAAAGFPVDDAMRAAHCRPSLARGDGMAFLAGVAMHRGVAPRHGHRDVFLLVLRPSLNPWEVELTGDGFEAMVARQTGSLPMTRHPAQP